MRGYQRKVIYMKNTGSHSFEEAYFVVRSDVAERNCSSVKMIEEANRIIEENFEKKKGGFLYSKRWYIASFLTGCALTVALCAIFYGFLR